MAAARQGLPVRLDRAPQRGAAFAITRASRRARTRSIGSRSRARGSSLIFDHPPAVAPPPDCLMASRREPCTGRSAWLPLGRACLSAWIEHRSGAFRSSRADTGPQILPPARATVPPWLPAKSARVSNLPACCALAPLASAAQYSCRREACTGRSAWLPLGRACLSAWIEHRSGEQRSP